MSFNDHISVPEWQDDMHIAVWWLSLRLNMSSC